MLAFLTNNRLPLFHEIRLFIPTHPNPNFFIFILLYKLKMAVNISFLVRFRYDLEETG